MKKRSPFTLIELLVVIAIIAILASMLLPALNKARKRARSIKCISNQKQLGAYINYYMDDNRDFMPDGNVNNGAGSLSNHSSKSIEKLFIYSSVKKMSNLPSFMRLGTKIYYINGVAGAEFLCPDSLSDPRVSDFHALGSKEPLRNNYGFNVAFLTCTYISQPGGYDARSYKSYHRKRSMFPRSRRAIMTDANGPNGVTYPYFKYTENSGTEESGKWPVSPRHGVGKTLYGTELLIEGKAYNALMSDFSVKTISEEYMGVNADKPYGAWFDVFVEKRI